MADTVDTVQDVIAHADDLIAQGRALLEQYERRQHEAVIEFILTRIHSLQLNAAEDIKDEYSNLIAYERGAIMNLLSVLDITATTLNVNVEEARKRLCEKNGWPPDWNYNAEV